MSRIRIVVFLSFFLFLFICVGPLSAQRAVGAGRLGGKVLNEDGDPIAGATVKVRIMAVVNTKREGYEVSTTSDAKGKWKLIGLVSGWSDVTASAPGYTSFTHKVEISQVYEDMHLNFKLKRDTSFQDALANLGPDPLAALSEYVEDGNRLYKQRRFEEAIAAYGKFEKEQPDAHLIHYYTGICYQQMEQFDTAQAEFEKVVEGFQKEGAAESGQVRSQVLFTLAELLAERGQREEALGYFRASLEADPYNEKVAYNLGDLCFALQRGEEAVEYLQSALDIRPSWSEPLLKLGYVYLNLEQYSQAESSFRKYLELNPEAPERAEINKILEELKNK